MKAATVSLICAVCGSPFMARKADNRKCCSVACGNQYSGAQRMHKTWLVGDTEPSPLTWDGRTLHSDVPQTRDYYLTCMLCARQVALKLTDSDARMMRQRRCECGSRMMLELDAGRATQPSTRPTVRRPNPVLAETRI